VNITTRNDTPHMRDLHKNIIRQYATQWEKLGIELGLEDYEIANISENNINHPRRVEECYTAVLEQWLQELPSPTWDKLDNAIKKITANVIPNYKEGMYVTSYMYIV